MDEEVAEILRDSITVATFTNTNVNADASCARVLADFVTLWEEDD